MEVSRADKYVKNLRNVPIIYPTRYLYNIKKQYTKFDENPLMFTQVSVWKRQYGWKDV